MLHGLSASRGGGVATQEKHRLLQDAPYGVVWKQEDWIGVQDRKSQEARRGVFSPGWRRALPMLPFRIPFAQPRARIPRWRCPPPAFCVTCDRFAVLFQKHCCSRKARHAPRRMSRLRNTHPSWCAWHEHGLEAAAAEYCVPRSGSEGERSALLLTKKRLNGKCRGLLGQKRRGAALDKSGFSLIQAWQGTKEAMGCRTAT